MRCVRALPTLAASVLALALLTSCSVPSAPTDAVATDAAAGAWSYDSGDGKTYTAEQVPTRVIAHAYAAKALMEFGITPVAIYADGPIAEDVGLQGVDFSGIEVIGQEWGKIDVAAAADLQPDLIVGDWWPAENAYSGLESGVEEQSKKIADLAPVVGPSQGGSAAELIEGYADLAQSLGADPSRIDAARSDFEAAVADFRAANHANPDVSALAVSPNDGDYYVAVPQYAPELLDMQRWGLGVIDPTTPDAAFPYWQTLSMEQADTYQPDLLMFDDRSFPANEQLLAATPIAPSISAYAAGQTTTWPAYWLHTYGDYTAQLTRLAGVVRGADASVGSA